MSGIQTELDNIKTATAGRNGNLFIRRNDGPLSANWEVTIDYEGFFYGKAEHVDLPTALRMALEDVE